MIPLQAKTYESTSRGFTRSPGLTKCTFREVGFPRIQKTHTHTHTHTHSSNITSQEIPIEINNQHKALDFYPLIVDFELEQLMFNKDSKFLTTDLA